MKSLSRSVAVAAALVAALVLATAAHADPLKCKAEINKDFAKYIQAKTKAMQKCREAIAKGKIPGPCPDVTAAAKLTKADSKVRAGIGKQCGGVDKICGGAQDEALSDIGFPTVCTNFANTACSHVITDCSEISECLLCLGNAGVDQAISLYYDDLDTNQFGTSSDINKCQIAIGKNAAKFLAAKSKALSKCEASVLKGTIPGPCPDALVAQPKIDKAESKKRAGICKACGGADKLCDGNGDLTPAQIGFAASCPSSGTCGGAISTLQDIVDCVDCLGEFNDDCFDAMGVPALKSYPTACNAVPVPCATTAPGSTCPTKIVTEANGEAVDLDTGWTGQSHDAHAPTQNRLTLAISGCSSATSPCGVCTTSGPLDNPGGAQFNNHRCQDDPHFACTTNADCTGTGLPGGPCVFFFGSPLPLSAGGVAVCVTNKIIGAITGTVNVESGETENVINLISRVHTAADIAVPCPNCVGGVCTGGPHSGQPCVVGGHSNRFGDVSFDCPPNPGAAVGDLPITLAYSTGVQTRTLTADSPACRAQTALKCFCDTCNNATATPCTSNADCVAVGATICGGRRCQTGANAGAPCAVSSECPGSGCAIPGQASAPNQCDDLTCSAATTCVGGSNAFTNCSSASECPGGTCSAGNEGTCDVGPFDTFCFPQETFRGCSVDADCSFPGDTCAGGKFRDCFLDNGIASQCVGGLNNTAACTDASECPGGTCGGSVTVTGVPYPSCGDSGQGSIGALFCVPPTASTSVNSVSGLPGLGRVLLPYAATFVQ